MRKWRVCLILIGSIATLAEIACVRKPPEVINRSPIANAGLDKTIILPVNTITLDASASNDPDNDLITYNWEKITGPASFTIVNPSAIQTEVTNLVEGEYEFELSVTDTKGAYTKDRCRVLVVVDRPAFSISAGPIYSLITLPTNSIALKAHVFIPPNSVADFQWSKISGPASSNISAPASLETLITDLVTGVYVFECKMTGASGFSVSARCTVSVIDPASTDHEVIIPNMTWIENVVWCSYMDITLDSYIPAGTPIKKIFIKPDCTSAWIEVFIESVNTNNDAYDYTIFGNMLNIQWCEGGCSVTDTPALKIVY